MIQGEPLLDRDGVARALSTLSAAIASSVPRDRLALVGVRRGGVPIAERLSRSLPGVVPVGSIEIALYRDDAATALPDPKIGPSQIPFDVEGRDVVIVDDVLQTGRTIRAAIDGILDYGRPRRMWLAVLLDRGGRELPIAPDFVGLALDPKIVEATRGARLLVDMTEGSEAVRVERRS
jgi:pyrimidine operon attenuation protein / uracil phosphoribosyltransferase